MFIYIVTNKINGKQYVGQTCKSPTERWKGHVQASRSGRVDCRTFYAALRKYGVENFEFTPLSLSFDSQFLLDLAERWFIDELNTRVPEGYNLNSGGHGGLHSEETKRKIGLAHVGMKRSAESLERMSAWQKGRKMNLSPEQRERRRRLATGRRLSTATRARMSAERMGKPSPLRGKKRGPMSEEQKKKISDTKKAQKRVMSEGEKEIRRNRSLENWQNEEYRLKVITANVGRVRSLSVVEKQKMEEGKQAYWKKWREARANGG